MAVVRCAIVPKGGGQVQNVIMADPDKDQPYPGTVFVQLADGERADSRFEYWGEVAIGFRFRPTMEFAAEYYEGIRVKGAGAATAAARRNATVTTAGLAAEYGYVNGTAEKTAFDEGVARVVVA